MGHHTRTKRKEKLSGMMLERYLSALGEARQRGNAAMAELKIGGEDYNAVHAFNSYIDALQYRWTGREDYFWDQGTHGYPGKVANDP